MQETANVNQSSPANVSFTEEMKGYVTFGETDYDRGFREGRKNNNFLMFHLTITAHDIDKFIADPRHVAATVGYVQCDAFGGQRPVENGIFNLFVQAEDPTMKNMLYRLFFRDADGNPLTLSGHKNIKNDPGFDIWSDTTTLFTHILRGHVSAEDESNAEIVAAGIINIYFMDFMKQLTTFRAEAPTAAARAAALKDFGQLFLGALWDTYAKHIIPAVG